MVDMVEEMKIIDEARRVPQPQMVARFVSSTRCVTRCAFPRHGFSVGRFSPGCLGFRGQLDRDSGCFSGRLYCAPSDFSCRPPTSRLAHRWAHSMCFSVSRIVSRGQCRCDCGPSFFHFRIWTIFHKRRATYDIDNAHQKFGSFGIG